MKKIGALALLIVIFAVLTPASGQDKAGLDVGDRVTNFKARDLSGKEISFEEDILDKTSRTMIFFMTTACSACFEELK
ncbi:MAG: hypothetical protein GTO08_07830, partial [Deltaproteobacteria bacterium]|nr:hypothetical protein [Deltaproteobacteria bacterium]